MNRSKSSAIHLPFPRTKVARDFLPHPVEPQKRNLILDTEHPNKRGLQPAHTRLLRGAQIPSFRTGRDSQGL